MYLRQSVETGFKVMAGYQSLSRASIYLTALAHPSRKEWVLKGNIQSSTGNTNVCKKVKKEVKIESHVDLKLFNKLFKLANDVNTFDVSTFLPYFIHKSL